KCRRSMWPDALNAATQTKLGAADRSAHRPFRRRPEQAGCATGSGPRAPAHHGHFFPGGAKLPWNFNSTAPGQAQHTFAGLVLRKRGYQKVTVADTLDVSLTGSVIVHVLSWPGAAGAGSLPAQSSTRTNGRCGPRRRVGDVTGRHPL